VAPRNRSSAVRSMPREDTMGFRYELRLSGAGGQGLLLAGKIIAEAAAIYDGKIATQAQSYGPEARGGASKSEVVISDRDIDYPVATNLDLLLALTQESVDAYVGDVKDGGIVLVDSDLVEDVPDGSYRIVSLPIVSTARDQVGRVISANLVAIGIIAGLIDVVTVSAIESAIRARVPRGTEEFNLKAFHAGLDMVRKLNEQPAG
jgi:2-oxoglutarate ferredoxin oxidoreductase subunit gamma